MVTLLPRTSPGIVIVVASNSPHVAGKTVVARVLAMKVEEKQATRLVDLPGFLNWRQSELIKVVGYCYGPLYTARS
jgi:ABC-type protease/lipase transport system fused ATPase/permease subunit